MLCIQSYFPPYFFHLAGLLWVLLKQGDAVPVLMAGSGAQHSAGGSQGSQNPSQNQEQQSPDRCPLPLILKKVSVQTSCPPPGPSKPHILVVTIIITRDSNPGLMCLWMRIQRGFYTGQIFALHVWEINAKITSRQIFSVVAHNGVKLMTSAVFSSSPQLTLFSHKKNCESKSLAGLMTIQTMYNHHNRKKTLHF